MKSGTSILTRRQSILVISLHDDQTPRKQYQCNVLWFMCSCTIVLGGNFVNVGCQYVYDVVVRYGTILV